LAAPCTVSYRDEHGNRYQVPYPDGVAVPQNERERATLEAMRKVGNCFYYTGDKFLQFQQPPKPINPNEVN
jgi:hypothetical protein